MKFITAKELAGPVDSILAMHYSPNNQKTQSKKLICRTVLTVGGFGGTTFIVRHNSKNVMVTGEFLKAVDKYNEL